MPGLTILRTLFQRCNSATSSPTDPSSVTAFYKEHCIYLPAMLGWFFFSALLSLYNKYVFGSSHLAFPCPLLMTSVHFLSQWGFSYTISSIYPVTLGGDQVSGMSWKTFLGIAIPCGLVTSADVGFSNLALVRISVTFYTMVKASSPIFVVLSAYLFGIEKITTPLILVVIVICMGELLTVLGEVKFDLIGFILCFIASVLSGMRWTVVQLKIQSLEPKLKSTFATMRILSPFMFLFMVGMSLVKEQPWNSLGEWIGSFEDLIRTLSLAVFGASLAICMVFCEFYLIMRSSAIVLMIGGVLKELNTILFGVYVFGDELNAINILGCVVVFTGVILYKASLHVRKLEKQYDTLTEVCGSHSERGNENETSGDGNPNGDEGSEQACGYTNSGDYTYLDKNNKDDNDVVAVNTFVIDDEEDNKENETINDKNHVTSSSQHEII